MSARAPTEAEPRRWRTLAGWLLATGLAALAFREVQWGGVAGALARSRPVWLMAAVGANALILALWTLQWGWFVRERVRVGLLRMFEVVSVMSTFSNGGPLFAGQAAGVHLLATRGEAGYPAAVGVLALDQLAEGVAKLALLGTVALAFPLPPALQGARLALLVGVLGLAAGLYLLACAGGARQRDGSSAPSRSWERARAFLEGMAEHVGTARRPRTILVGVLLALGMKAAELLGILAVQRALGVEVELGVSLLVLASVAVATMLSVSPANLGIYEASAFAAYRLGGIPAEAGAALALVQHAVFLVPAAGIGWALLTWRGIRELGTARPPPAPEPAPVEGTGD